MLLAPLAGGHAARRMTCGRGGKRERGIGLAGHAVLALNRVRLAGSSASRAAKGAAAVNAGHQRLRRVTACAEHTRSYNTVQTRVLPAAHPSARPHFEGGFAGKAVLHCVGWCKPIALRQA